ncbi:F0F1 ATP synthase subunit B [Candidatus Berkelbacteria bacterium]|nr:F0F1 ATP synthase subunit B [Candidatus Berkelbacteria bacterium]
MTPEPTGLAALGIDGKLIIAQIVNFFIVFLLLRLLAFKPIVAMLGERRKRIAAAMKDAAEIEKRKAETVAESQKILDQAKGQAQTILDGARKDASALLKATQDSLKTQQEKMIADAKQEMMLQTERAYEQARKDIAYLAVKVSEKILRGEINEKRNSKLIEQALKELA